MKSRAVAFAVCLLYVMVALITGNLHHHHGQGPLADDGHCAACVWHISGVATTPLVFTPISVASYIAVLVPPCHSVAPRKIFCLVSASRAPPVTPA